MVWEDGGGDSASYPIHGQALRAEHKLLWRVLTDSSRIDRLSAGDLDNRVSFLQSLNLLLLMLEQVKVISGRVSPAAYQWIKVDLFAFPIKQLSSLAVCL